MNLENKKYKLKAFDIIACCWLQHEGPNVVIPCPTRGLLLVPLTFINVDDDETFSKTHAKAAYRSVESLNDKDYYLIGQLERKWIVSGPQKNYF